MIYSNFDKKEIDDLEEKMPIGILYTEVKKDDRQPDDQCGQD